MERESPEQEYEYIVVGSGAGGGPVAANLARAGHTVLVLEAGGGDEGYEYQVPAFHPAASEDPPMSWRFFVRHYADPEQQRRDPKYVADEGGVFYPRAATLGGCTAHNALILTYPSNRDWDAIAELTGDPSWGARSMRRYYQRLEDCRYRGVLRLLYKLLRLNPSRHGFGGWLSTEEADPRLALEDRTMRRVVLFSALRNLASSGGAVRHFLRFLYFLAIGGDPNSWWSIRRGADGFRFVPLTRAAGRRVGSRELLLAAAEEVPDRLTIQLGALVTRVLFDDGMRAVGVEYLEGAHLYRADPQHRPDAAGRTRRARATREVILAGGAFNTPQLLQLSGIGPGDVLRRHGIPVRLDRPGVGANLQDRYEVSVVLRMRKPFTSLQGATLRPPGPGEEPDRQFREWTRGRGLYTSNGAAVALIQRSQPELPHPDLFLFGLVSKFYGYFPGYSREIQDDRERRHFSWAILKGHTHNTAGRVAIRSADPRDPPEVNFHYFEEGTDADGEDLEAVVGAVELVRRIVAGYGQLVEEEVLPGPGVRTRDELRRFVRDQAWGHHASCTCKIGPAEDPMAVLDGDFRVHGATGLRVVDASVFPRIPGLFIALPVFMIAEKASDVILADAAAGRPRPNPPTSQEVPSHDP